MTKLEDERCHRRCVIIMVKEPVAGQVKTRLAASIGIKHTLTLYQCFIADTIALAQQVPETDVALAYWPGQAHGHFAAAYPDQVLVPQYGTNLGERLLSAFRQAHAAGYDQCVILSSDSPSLPSDYLALGFEHLAATPVVLGPCDDGGYYLIGSQQPHPHLFHDIAWSTEVVYRQTVDRAAAAGLAVATLPPWYDIDTIADLDRLYGDLCEHPLRAAPATLAMLSDILRGHSAVASGEEHDAS